MFARKLEFDDKKRFYRAAAVEISSSRRSLKPDASKHFGHPHLDTSRVTVKWKKQDSHRIKKRFISFLKLITIIFTILYTSTFNKSRVFRNRRSIWGHQ